MHIKLHVLNLIPETFCRARHVNYFTAFSFIKDQFSSEVSRTKSISITCRLQKAFSYGDIVQHHLPVTRQP